MEINGKVYCFFEQSGTFKNEFRKLGISAFDYDIQNNFGQTDVVLDLFQSIERCYDGLPSVFDNVSFDDLIIAFFPCIYFSVQNEMFFNGVSFNFKNMSVLDRAEFILERSRKRQQFYEVILKLFTICDHKGLRLIVENPYSVGHYLINNFPYQPTMVDSNRLLRGDYFSKPTAYWFLNCLPTYGESFQFDKKQKYITSCCPSSVAGLCSESRSMISSDYARNFISDFILGVSQPYSQLTLNL